MVRDDDRLDMGENNGGCTVTKCGLRVLRELHGVNANTGGRIGMYKAARLVHEDKYEGLRRTFKHNVVTTGCVISESDGDARARDATVYHAVFGIATVDRATK